MISAMRFAGGHRPQRRRRSWRAGPGRITVSNRKDWILRGFYGAVSMILSYLAIARTVGRQGDPPGQHLPDLRGPLRRPLLPGAAEPPRRCPAWPSAPWAAPWS
ncbi:MAG: hypothetical protein MZU95_09245 [Desulfomicrobium escambiense]|nr:hypothetical protein [Desulfomicrobium escambiense]